jgi:hypothetical protein
VVIQLPRANPHELEFYARPAGVGKEADPGGATLIPRLASLL